MIDKLGVDIIRDLLDDKERQLDDLLRVKRGERTENFCWTVKCESVDIRSRGTAQRTSGLQARCPSTAEAVPQCTRCSGEDHRRTENPTNAIPPVVVAYTRRMSRRWERHIFLRAFSCFARIVQE